MQCGVGHDDGPDGPRVLKLTLAYDGSAYRGWQRQPAERTVQGVLEAAIRSVTGEAVKVVASGRTDAGVHALGQVAHFRSGARLAPDVLRRALNARLPDDVVVLAAADAAPDFHARYGARRKTYFYQLLLCRDRHPLHGRFALHLRQPLEVEAMRVAAARLVGRHDFRAFATEGGMRRDTVRHLQALRVLRTRRGLRVFATADGFLQHMVRNLVGLLVQVGRGALAAEAAAAVLESRDRRLAPAALPAHALFLWRVDY